MMRGASYDDSYITRKMTQLPGPTFAAPGHAYGRPPMGGYIQGYHPMGPPPPRHLPRIAPGYYDYDYGYGGGYYGYAPPPPPPRMSRYDTYLEDDLEPTYVPRYRSRVMPDTLDDSDYRKDAPADAHMAAAPAYAPPAPHARPQHPLLVEENEEDLMAVVPRRASQFPVLSSSSTAGRLRPTLQSLPRQDTSSAGGAPQGATEGERHLARLSMRYPSLSEPQMLQDHVDKMRIKLKSLAYSLDPTGPVPEIILPDRVKKSGHIDDKKYSSAPEFTELPKLASRRQRYYPEDDQMKDNLRIKCLSHYKTTRTAADWELRDIVKPDSYNRSSKYSASKWEEPDTVFGAPSDRKPFSKAITDGTTDEEKKERRKKKKSKERDIVGDADVASAPAPAAPAPAPAPIAAAHSASDVAETVSATTTDVGADDPLDEEKERKKQEKKKRKAEREAAAKAAMEAELAALAAAEAELARLEADSTPIKPEAPAPAADAAPAEAPAAEPAAEVKSESAAEKSDEPSKVKRKLQSATTKIMAAGAFLRSNISQKKSPAE